MAPDWVSSLSPSTLLGQAEVGDVRLALVVEQDVGRLEVAVEDAALVGVVDGPAASATSRAAARGSFCEAVEPLGEAAALDQLHAEVVLALVLADLVDRHDVGVVEPATASASFWNRRSSASSARTPARIIFRATRRFRLSCLAW